MDREYKIVTLDFVYVAPPPFFPSSRSYSRTDAFACPFVTVQRVATRSFLTRSRWPLRASRARSTRSQRTSRPFRQSRSRSTVGSGGRTRPSPVSRLVRRCGRRRRVREGGRCSWRLTGRPLGGEGGASGSGSRKDGRGGGTEARTFQCSSRSLQSFHFFFVSECT